MSSRTLFQILFKVSVKDLAGAVSGFLYISAFNTASLLLGDLPLSPDTFTSLPLLSPRKPRIMTLSPFLTPWVISTFPAIYEEQSQTDDVLFHHLLIGIHAHLHYRA